MAKVCLISSPGGHLSEVLSAVEGGLGKHDFFLCVTGFGMVRDMRLEGIRRIYYMPMLWRYQEPYGVIVSLLVSLPMFVWILLKERPDVLVTAGAEVAIPAFLVNRLLGRRPALFIESVTRIHAPSRTGRWIARLATRVFVQWPEVLAFYGAKGEYHGGLL
jgi:beta-1,4-N-acetylglucosaminyltransferase